MRNTAIHSERCTRHYNENNFRNFQEKSKVYNHRINGAYGKPDPRASQRKWQVLFGERFR